MAKNRTKILKYDIVILGNIEEAVKERDAIQAGPSIDLLNHFHLTYALCLECLYKMLTQ